MADLIAQGKQPHERWRRRLVEGRPATVGRAAGTWQVDWDPHLSRRHFRVLWEGGKLLIEMLPDAKNPIYYRGRESRRFVIRPGELFVVGNTVFRLVDQEISIEGQTPEPTLVKTLSPRELTHVVYKRPDLRLTVLSRLPEVIEFAGSDTELAVRLVGMLLAAIPHAEAAAVVSVEHGLESHPAEDVRLRVVHWDCRGLESSIFRPSKKLISDAVREGRTVLFSWTTSRQPSQYTAQPGVDWAFCTPLPQNEWVLYVAGKFEAEDDPTDKTLEKLEDDVKFTEVLAAVVASLHRLRSMERRNAMFSQFFSPVIVEQLFGGDPEQVLKPRKVTASVLFCDLRGFSRESERLADDLFCLLERTSDALGVMTQGILEHGGVVGDFQGDAAMGFWGWPLPQRDMVLQAAQAALDIRLRFEQAAAQPSSSLAGFRAGIGIATGEAVAGKIGTPDHAKITVFGPVVNRAKRLEELTKLFHAPVLVDKQTAEQLRQGLPAELGRVRRLAIVRPRGLADAIELSELLPPYEAGSVLSDQHLQYYEKGLDAFIAGRWDEALDWLRQVPTADRAADFLLRFILQRNRMPPSDWKGVIDLHSYYEG